MSVSAQAALHDLGASGKQLVSYRTAKLPGVLAVLSLTLAMIQPLRAANSVPPCGKAGEESASAGASAGTLAYGLDDLASLAARRHPSVAAKRSALAAAKEDHRAARLQYLPTPSVQDAPSAGGGHTTTFSVQQPIYTGGRLRAGVDVATARIHSAEEGLLETQQGLGFAVANAYQAMLQASGRSDVLHRLMARLDGYRSSMLRRVEGGISAEGELDLLNARYALVAGQLKSTCYAQNAARAQLSLLVDMPLSAGDIRVSKVAADLPDFDEVLGQVQAKSPALRRLDQEVLAARADADAKAAAQRPSVALVAQRTMPNGVANVQASSSVGLQWQYAPGAGWSSVAVARSAESMVEALRASREAARVDLVAKVRTVYDELQSAMARRGDGQLNAQATASVLASYERLFLAGRRSSLDLMNTARELSDAELAAVDIEAQITVGSYRLQLYGAQLAWMTAGD